MSAWGNRTCPPTSQPWSATGSSSTSAPSATTRSARIRTELAPWLGPDAFRGRNDFEGFETNRVYALLAKAPAVAELVEHPWVMSILDELLEPNPLLSANLAINLLPGETAQQVHIDDAFYKLPWPRPMMSVSTIWAIDEFTTDNGATEVIPGSHHWDGVDPAPSAADAVPVLMPAGSVVLFAGHALAPRRRQPQRPGPPGHHPAVLPAVGPPAGAADPQRRSAGGARIPQRIQSLLGYSIHPPFMGHVDGLHPQRLLDGPYDAAATGAGAVIGELLGRAGRRAGHLTQPPNGASHPGATTVS